MLFLIILEIDIALGPFLSFLRASIESSVGLYSYSVSSFFLKKLATLDANADNADFLTSYSSICSITYSASNTLLLSSMSDWKVPLLMLLDGYEILNWFGSTIIVVFLSVKTVL